MWIETTVLGAAAVRSSEMLEPTQEFYPLDVEQAGRLKVLMKHLVTLAPNPNFPSTASSFRIPLNELLHEVHEGPCRREVYLVGGAASYVIGGTPFGDIDLMMFHPDTPEASYETYRHHLLRYVQCKAIEKNACTPEQGWNARFIWDNYFYKSNEDYLCLSLGELDLKFPRFGARTHLFDHDANALHLSDKAVFQRTVVPNAKVSVEEASDALRTKKLRLSSPEEVYNFHFRVLQKFTEGFSVDDDLMCRSFTSLRENSLSGRFQENFRFFLQNHIPRARIPLFLTNMVLLARRFGNVHDLQKIVSKEFDAEDLFLKTVATGLLHHPDVWSVEEGRFWSEQATLYLPKSIEEILVAIYEKRVVTQQECLEIVLGWYQKQPTPLKLAFVRHQFFPFVRQNQNGELDPLLERKIGDFEAPFLDQEWRERDPFGYFVHKVAKSPKYLGLLSELFPKMLEQEIETEKLLDLFLKCKKGNHLTERRRLLAERLCTPKWLQKDPAQFFSSLEKLFSETGLEEMYQIDPDICMEWVSHYITTESILIAKRVKMLTWVQHQGHQDALSSHAMQRLQLLNANMPMEDFRALFIRNHPIKDLRKWLKYAFRHTSKTHIYFESLYEKAESFEDILSLASLFHGLGSPIGGEVLAAHNLAQQGDWHQFVQAVARLPKKEKKCFFPAVKESLVKKPPKPEEGVEIGLTLLSVPRLFDQQLNWIEKEIPREFWPAWIRYLWKNNHFQRLNQKEAIRTWERILQLFPDFWSEPKGEELCAVFVAHIDENGLFALQDRTPSPLFEKLIQYRGVATEFSGSQKLKLCYFPLIERGVQKGADWVPSQKRLIEFCHELLEEGGCEAVESNLIHLYAKSIETNPAEVEKFLKSVLQHGNAGGLYGPLLQRVIDQHPGLTLHQRICHELQERHKVNTAKLRPTWLIEEVLEELYATDPKDPIWETKEMREMIHRVLKEGKTEDIQQILNLVLDPKCVAAPGMVRAILGVCVTSERCTELSFLKTIQSFLEQNLENALSLVEHPKIGPYLKLRLNKIEKVAVRAHLIGTYLMRYQSQECPETFFEAAISCIRNHADLARKNFLSKEEMIHLYGSLNESFQEAKVRAKWFISLTNGIKKGGLLIPAAFNQVLAQVCRSEKPIFSLQEELELWIWNQQRDGPLFEKFLSRLLEKNGIDTLDEAHMRELIKELCLRDKKEIYNRLAPQLLIYALKRKSCGQEVEQLLIWMRTLSCSKEELEPVIQFLMENEVLAENTQSIQNFLEHLQGTLFFPGPNEFSCRDSRVDFAILSLISRKTAENLFMECFSKVLWIYQDIETSLSGIKPDLLEKVTLRFLEMCQRIGLPFIHDPMHHYLSGFLKAIEHTEGFEQLWLQMLVEEIPLAREKNQKKTFLERLRQCTPHQQLQLISIRMECFNGLLNEYDIFFQTVEKFRIENPKALVNIVEEAPFEETEKRVCRAAFSSPKKYIFITDQMEGELVAFLEILANSLHKKKHEGAFTLAAHAAVETYLLWVAKLPKKGSLQIRLIQHLMHALFNLFSENEKWDLMLHFLDSLTQYLDIVGPVAFADIIVYKELFQYLLIPFMEGATIHLESIVSFIFQLYEVAKRSNSQWIQIESASLLLAAFKNTTAEKLEHTSFLKLLFQKKVIGLVSDLLNLMDKSAFEVGKKLFDTYKIFFPKEFAVSWMNQRILTDVVLYTITPGNLVNKLGLIQKKRDGLANAAEKIAFTQRVVLRCFYLFRELSGDTAERFSCGLDNLFEEQIYHFLRSAQVRGSEEMAIAFVEESYMKGIAYLFKCMEKNIGSHDAFYRLSTVVARRKMELLSLLTTFPSLSLSANFASILKQMQDLIFGAALSVGRGMNTEYVEKMMCNYTAFFTKASRAEFGERSEKIVIVTAFYSYVTKLGEMVKKREELNHKNFYLQRALEALIGCNDLEGAKAFFADDFSCKFALTRFVETLESNQLLSTTERSAILINFKGWLSEKAAKYYPSRTKERGVQQLLMAVQQVG